MLTGLLAMDGRTTDQTARTGEARFLFSPFFLFFSHCPPVDHTLADPRNGGVWMPLQGEPRLVGEGLGGKGGDYREQDRK